MQIEEFPEFYLKFDLINLFVEFKNIFCLVFGGVEEERRWIQILQGSGKIDR